jgi:two-component system, LytTR family, response regulator
MALKTLIIDDEQIARDVLRGYMQKYCPDVDIIGEAVDCNDAIKKIKDLQPALVLLDIEMPFGNAFDVIEQTKDINFEVIFITAYNDYAIQAFNTSALYYILKPINIDELVMAVDKAKQTWQGKLTVDRKANLIDNKSTTPLKQQVILPTMQGFDVVKLVDIVNLQANGNFTDVFLQNGTKKMVCKFLKHFEDLLPEHFVRVHRSHIVNVHFVKSFSKSMGGFVTLHDNTEIEVSGSYKDSLIERLSC